MTQQNEDNEFDILALWEAWVPFVGEPVEEMGMTAAHARLLIPYISSPTLIVGAGMGLIVRVLRDAGIEVLGIDFCPGMIRGAWERRRVPVILAPAHDLPFVDDYFASVLIPTGVLTLPLNEEMRHAILAEAIRVLSPRGTFAIALFGNWGPTVEALCKLGVCIGGTEMDDWRLISLWRSVGDLEQQARLVSEWTGQSLTTGHALVEQHMSVIKGQVRCFDWIAQRLEELGYDVEAWLQEMYPSVRRPLCTKAQGIALFEKLGLEQPKFLSTSDHIVQVAVGTLPETG